MRLYGRGALSSVYDSQTRRSFMRTSVIFLCVSLAAIGCRKNGSGGGGGGGGGWLIGGGGLMENITVGNVVSDYNLQTNQRLDGIACRYSGEAWVVGSQATLLYTNDAGKTWSQQIVPTNADLHALATQDFGPVFIAGDGVMLTSKDTGASW